MPVKYEREEQLFKNMKEVYEKQSASDYVFSEILWGWETAEVQRLLDKSQKNAKAIISELDKLLDTIERRKKL